jgi:hypothetical protein
MKTKAKSILVAGILLIMLIKLVIRPYFHSTGLLQYLLGIAPNLLGSFLVPLGIPLLPQRLKTSSARLLFFNNSHQLAWVCTAVFIALTCNEYLQLIPVFGRTFDYHDLLASAVGLFTAFFYLRYKYFSGDGLYVHVA